MKEKPFIAPEEGNFNADIIKKGSPEEKKDLKKALKAVESGQFSSDTLTDLSDKSPSQEFFAQQSYEDDKQREREIYENDLEGFYKFIRAKNIPDDEISYENLDWYLSLPDTVERDEYIQQLDKLFEEWRESK